MKKCTSIQDRRRREKLQDWQHPSRTDNDWRRNCDRYPHQQLHKIMAYWNVVSNVDITIGNYTRQER